MSFNNTTFTIDEGSNFNSLNTILTFSPILTASATLTVISNNSDITPCLSFFQNQCPSTSIALTSGDGDIRNVFRVTAAEDDDTTDDTATLTFTLTGGGYSNSPITTTLNLTITDDDTPSGTIQVTPPGPLSVNEGSSANLSVSLSAAPNADVTVSLAKTNSDITLDKTSLTFTTENYRNGQRVTVNAAEDDDTTNDSDTITLSASGGITAPDVTKAVSVTDDDTAELDVTPTSLTITEGGQATFQVKLATDPSTNVQVDLVLSDSSLSITNITPNPTQTNDALLFGSAVGHDWNQYYTLTVSAAQDDDTDNESASIRLSVAPGSGGVYGSKTETVAVSVTDDDTPSGTIQVTPARALSINEGSSATLSVSLSIAPNANVRVSLAKTNSDITLSPTSLTFTAGSDGNWRTSQAVTVNAAEDDDTTNDSDTITLSATGGIDAPEVTKAVSVTDNDTPSGTIQVTPSSPLSVNEGSSATLSVRLSTAPNANVTVSLAKTNSDITLDKTSLTFSTSNWNRAQTITVNAAQDADTTNDSGTITLTASGGITAPPVTKAVSVVDDDDSSTTPSGAIQVTPSNTLRIDEGESGFFHVSLSAAPNADVRVSLSKTNTDITLSPSSLTFTVLNFSRAQRVTVSAAEDADATNDSDTIVLSASGGLDAGDKMKSVLVVDDDDPSLPSGSIVLSRQRLTIGEGRSGSVDISLDTAPNADVRISLSKTNADITLSPSSLTFTASNYRTTQSVTLSAAEDNDRANDSDTITFEASGGINADDARLSILVLDDDAPPIVPPPTNPYDGTLVFSPEGNITIDEAGDITIAIALSKRPIVNLPVLISKTSFAPGIGFSRASMVFTPEDWNEAQPLRVSAHEDADKDDSVHTIAFDFADKRILRKAIVRDNDKETLKTQALALPPPSSGDSVNLRIQCKQQTPCAVALDCTAQATGEAFEGSLPEPIPAWGAVSLSSRDIQAYTGGESWAGKGRLGCALRSSANIGSQVWTRSGNGVLVNNSAMIRSVPEGDIHRADIESIPSPDASDESNIRIRCNSNIEDCLETSFVCYSDEGRRYAWESGSIERLTTRHLQSEELASGIGYRWQGLGLTCEVRSRGSFTAQVLTRTGGGGALVNNSATGVR